MTVNFSLAVSGPYTCDGVTTDFGFTFRLLSAAHLQITIYNATTGAVVSTLTSGSGYTVLTGGLKNDAGGTVRLTVAPASGNKVSIGRVVPYSQPNRIGNQGAFLPETHETTFDLLAMQIQQLARKVGGGMTLPIVDDPTLDMTLPNTITRAGKLLGFDANGKPVVGGNVSDLANLSSSVSAAALSAANASDASSVALLSAAAALEYAQAAAASAQSIDISSLLLKADNLAGLPDKAAARANLQLGDAATKTEAFLRTLPFSTQRTAAYVAAATDAGKTIPITTGGVTVNPSVFAANDIFSIYNESDATQVLTQGASMTLRKMGVASITGNLTIPARGYVTVHMRAANEALVSGVA